jgi:hypothetical protein
VSRRRRIVLGGLLLLAVVAGAAAVVLSRGVYERYPRTALLTAEQQRRAPAWTAPCWGSAPYTDNSECLHVRGRVVWVQKHDPDGDGDRHLVVVARLHARIVKLASVLGVTELPRLGTSVDAVGWLIHGSSGRIELNTQRLRGSGSTRTTRSGAAKSLIRARTLG